MPKTIENPDDNVRAAYEGIDVPILHKGSAIRLPDTPVKMSLNVGIETLKRKLDEEHQTVEIREIIDAFPDDGAVAFNKAMQRMFGWVTSVPTPGFFGNTPPQTKQVSIGPKEKDTISVIWSRFVLPGIENSWLSCDATDTAEGPRFVITGKIVRMYHPIITDLINLTKKIAAGESIYRGKAIKLQVDSDGDVLWNDGISFIDLSRVDRNELVFSKSTQAQISTSLWTPIKYTDQCRQHKIPLKRGILLEGKYGTGKTLTSSVTAQLAIENGWTFLTINRVGGLQDALKFARRFQPCVIFAEDIDQSMSGSDRTVKIDDILNVIDGIESKGTEIFVVVTTNHIEKMNRAMLRPGRLDAIVTVTAPDAEAVKKLIANYGRTMIGKGTTFDRAAKMLEGKIPAMIREAVERSKLYAITRSGDEGLVGELTITDDDLCAATEGMEMHFKLLEEPVAEKREPSFKEIVSEAVARSVNDEVATLYNAINEVGGLSRSSLDQIGSVRNMMRGANDRLEKMSGPSGSPFNSRELIELLQTMKEGFDRKKANAS